jgi:hypothetical protein
LSISIKAAELKKCFMEKFRASKYWKNKGGYVPCLEQVKQGKKLSPVGSDS